MRNFVIGSIVLFTMAGTAFGETKEPPRTCGRLGQWGEDETGSRPGRRVQDGRR